MLTDLQRRRIHERLIEERNRALSDLRRSQATAAEGELTRTSDLSEAPTHIADRATETQAEELEATLSAREIAELDAIDAALERFYKRPHEFGHCERTGQAIPFERLDIVPWTTTC